jgi:tRNA(Ile)-lysidine synthase
VSAADGTPVSLSEARSLFADLTDVSSLVLAISGGPDSTALLLLAARWRKSLKAGPKLVAVTVDHGLRPEAKREAAAVKKLARSLSVEHRTMRWSGRKPSTGLQQAARNARYGLLAAAAKSAGARHILTAHTMDDQAETVLIRLARGSGVSGLAAMARLAPLPQISRERTGRSLSEDALVVVRPFLLVSKSRLIKTLRAAGIEPADDPSNRDPRFTRVRFRALMPELAREGLIPSRLSLLAKRVRRADEALESAVTQAASELAPGPRYNGEPYVFQARSFFELPQEVGLRLLGRAVDQTGDEGPVELGKLEALHAALLENPNPARFRRTLAGSVVTLEGDALRIERAPERRGRIR